MRPIKLFCFLLPFFSSIVKGNVSSLEQELFICYGKINPKKVQGYDTVILEVQHYTKEDIQYFKKHNGKVLAYISLTEVHSSSFYYDAIKKYTLEKNENWGSYFLNLKDQEVHEILLNSIKALVKKGVDGLFIDNLDNVSKWGKLYGQEEQLITIIKRINTDFNTLYIIQNSGLFLNKKLQEYTDAILIESVLTKYNFKYKKYDYQDIKIKKTLLSELMKAKKETKKPIYLVEYANEEIMKNHIEKEAVKLRFPCFVANIDLQTKPDFKK